MGDDVRISSLTRVYASGRAASSPVQRYFLRRLPIATVIVDSSPSRARGARSRFYVGAAFLIAVITLAGFAPALYATRFEDVTRPWFIHLHAVVFVGWLVLLVTKVCWPRKARSPCTSGWVTSGSRMVASCSPSAPSWLSRPQASTSRPASGHPSEGRHWSVSLSETFFFSQDSSAPQSRTDAGRRYTSG